MTQERIDQFARASEDFQWIHVDAARSARESPFKTTIAHGFLSLSLLTWFLERTLVFEGGTMGINYGFDRVRFVRPAPVGTVLRGRFKLVDVTERQPGTMQSTVEVTVEIEGEAKPALIAEWVTLAYL